MRKALGDDGGTFWSPMLYDLGYMNYQQKIRSNAISNTKDKEFWLESLMAKLDQKYKQKTNGEWLWDKVWWLWWSYSWSDINIYDQPSHDPRVTPWSYSQIKQNELEIKQHRPILKSQDEIDSGIIYADNINDDPFDQDQKNHLHGLNHSEEMYEKDGWGLYTEWRNELYKEFWIICKPLSEKPKWKKKGKGSR